jgi:hypothetical protein
MILPRREISLLARRASKGIRFPGLVINGEVAW